MSKNNSPQWFVALQEVTSNKGHGINRQKPFRRRQNSTLQTDIFCVGEVQPDGSIIDSEDHQTICVDAFDITLVNEHVVTYEAYLAFHKKTVAIAS